MAQNKVLFFQTDWGFEGTTEVFIKKAKISGYDGIEIWSPIDPKKQIQISKLLKEHNMKVIFLCGSNSNLPFENSLSTYKEYLKNTIKLNPVAINSHTGSDFYSFSQNMRFIEEANKLSNHYNIPIYHETHRGRFSYSLPKTIEYIEKNKDLVLTLDISHWMVVHESLLDNRTHLLKKIIKRSNHIHARVGFQEGPQVNDPAAPEWKSVVERHLNIWKSVIQKIQNEKKIPTITTEFGPPNYMPTLPNTQEPMTDQWMANLYIMKMLKKRLNE
ncbi:MAG: xylose isomerase [Flavobacteriaceae bacterium]|nr:xylose isomerase [Flavobacteriaceae bacterium]